MATVSRTPPTVASNLARQGFRFPRNFSGDHIKVRCPNGHQKTLSIFEAANFTDCDRCTKSTKPKPKPQTKATRARGKPRERSLKRWARVVIAKANFTCHCCGQVGGDLEAHHLWSYESYPEKRHQLSNGMCLCKTCHTDFHRRYGFGDNTPDQMTQYLSEQKANV